MKNSKGIKVTLILPIALDSLSSYVFKYVWFYDAIAYFSGWKDDKLLLYDVV